MADQTSTIKINIETGAGGKSLSALKNEFKETQKTLEGLDTSSKAYVKTLEKLGGIKDQIGDLNTEIKAFNPEGKVQAFGNVIGGLASGFQAAQGAAALFGAEGEELQKTLLKVQAASAFADGIKGVMGMGDAFKVLGNIIKQNPFYLLVPILIGIGTALFELKDKIAIVGFYFDLMGKAIDGVVQMFKDLTDWMGITSNASDDLAATQIKNAQEVGAIQQSNFDREINRLKAAGKATEEVEIQKQQAILKTLQLEVEAMRTAAMQRGSITEEEKKRIAEIIKLAGEAKEEIVLINIGKNKQITDDNKKAYDQQLKDLAEHQKHLAEIDLILRQSAEDAREREYFEKLERDKKRGEDNLELLDEQQEEERAMHQEHEEIKVEFKQKLSEEERQQAIDGAQSLATSLAGIGDLVFAHQLNQAQGNAKKQNEIRKKQFKLGKALGIATATIDGIQAVQKALNNPYPLNIVLAAASGVMAAVNIAKIASTKFAGDDGGGEGGGGSLGAASGGVAIAPPTSSSTQLNADGTIKKPSMVEQPVVKAIVTETDITKTQTRISGIEEKSKLGG